MKHFRRALLAAALLIASLALPALAQSITIEVDQPQPNEKAGDTLNIKVKVTSTHQLQGVTAEVSGHTANLTYHGGEFRWIGDINLVGLPRGPLVLNVTAQDVFGSAVTKHVTFIHDKAPQLTITAPLQETVARPLIRITASCTDDGPEGCEIAVKHASETVFLLARSNSIDQDISLEQYEGTSVVLVFRALDSAGNTTVAERRVYVDSSRRLLEFHDVTGRIIDVQPNRILHNTDPGSPSVYDTTGTYLKIRDIAAGTDTEITPFPDKPLAAAFLTPRGAIFESRGAYGTERIYEWQDGALLEHGQPSSTRTLDVEGAYAVWAGGTYPDIRLLFRDIVTGTTTQIPFAGAVAGQADVAADGAVAFGSLTPYEIHLYDHGIVTQLTHTAGTYYSYTGPVTDGTNTAYTRTRNCDCAYPGRAIVRHDGTAEIEIASEAVRVRDPAPGLDYQVRNGWTAVTRVGTASEVQVWRLPPQGMGSAQQLSFFGSSSSIERLAPNGELTFLNAALRQRFLSTGSPAQTAQLGSDLGRAFHVDGQWYVAIGRSLFTINDDVTATTTALAQPASSSVQGETVTFTATVAPSNATGTVAFKDGGDTLITVPLSGGTATFSTNSLALGSHTIKAVYAGDESFASSVSPAVTHLVRKATSVTLTSQPNPSDSGQQAAFRAAVAGSGVTGTVTFYDGDTSLGLSELANGVALFYTAALSPGSHSITATYNGDSAFGPSTSPVLLHQVRSPFGAPAGLTATATGAAQVVVSWAPVSGATQYEVARSFNNGPFTSVALVSGTMFTDDAVSPATTYIYIVRAVGSSTSGWSARDIATTVVFTDNPLAPQVHTIKGAHLLQLRTAVNAARASGGLSPFAFTDPGLPAGTAVKAVHVQELRTALSEARAALLVPAVAYTDPALSAGGTRVKAIHFQELRNGCE